jgi:hypothetical protein
VSVPSQPCCILLLLLFGRGQEGAGLLLHVFCKEIGITVWSASAMTCCGPDHLSLHGSVTCTKSVKDFSKEELVVTEYIGLALMVKQAAL